MFAVVDGCQASFNSVYEDGDNNDEDDEAILKKFQFFREKRYVFVQCLKEKNRVEKKQKQSKTVWFIRVQ